MRASKLVPILAATFLVVATTGAIAAGRGPRPRLGGHPRVARSCHVSIDVAPHRLTAGDPVVIFGRLTCGQGSVAAQTVALLQRIAGGHGYSQAQSTTTDGEGFYELANLGAVNTADAWSVSADGAHSAAKQVGVAAHVVLGGPPDGAQLLTGAANHVTFSGSVSPSDAGYAVVLQRQDSAAGNVWHRIDAIGQVGPEGGFSIVHTFQQAGAANVRVVVTNRANVNPHNIPSPSNVLSYEVSLPQSPALSIHASADPISSGQPVTIGGAASGAGANQSVTLMARTSGGHFAAVAKATTDTAGDYSFPPQSPTASTFYMVKRAGKVSGRLFEGVADVLTAGVAPGTVQAGQALTFSGTVAPDHTGHTIYLERQDASGPGFHVVQVGTVGSGSSYSIAHTVYDTGAIVFRISIPGGPENQGAHSAPLPVTVTAAPLSTLTAEPPANSSLPVGGQL